MPETEQERFAVGSLVEREIDGMWFPAVVEGADAHHGAYALRYCDDGNEEEDVPGGELRRAHSRPVSEAAGAMRAAKERRAAVVPTLLSGLVSEEDVEIVECNPRVIKHGVNDDARATAFVLEGNQGVAMGGGLRALRSLRKR